MAASIRNLVSRKVTKALWEYKMLDPGDKVLVALSGGKDSTTLLLELAQRRPYWSIPYEIGAVYVHSDFANPEVEAFVQKTCAALGVCLTVIPVGVLRRLKPGERMNCYWCSLQRRSAILELARVQGYNKIAFGHHLDDTIETYLMNLMQFGQNNQGMKPYLRLDKYPVTFLRPLVYVEEREIVRYVQDQDLLRYTCTCDYGENSERKRIRGLIAELTQGNAGRKQNLLAAALSSN